MSEPTQAPRAALYSRVSTSGQNTGDPWASLPRQVEDMRALADRMRFEVILVVEEQGSGAKADRPGWTSVLEAARAGQVEVIMAVAFDRLTRSERIGDFEDLKVEMRGLKCRLITVKQGEIDLSGTADAETRSDIDAVLSKRERLIIRERTMRGRKALGEAGGYTGHTIPYGYRTRFDEATGSKAFEVNEEQAAVVREVFERFVRGEAGSHIASWLRESGHPAPGNAHWYDIAVWRMLDNPLYAGFSVWHRTQEGPLVPSTEFEPILSPDLWEVSRATREIVKLRAVRGSQAVYPLTGILRCSSCGSSCGRNPGHQRPGIPDRPVYRCGNRGERRKTPCQDASLLRADLAEAAVLAYLRERLPAFVERHRGLDALGERARTQGHGKPAPDPLAMIEKRLAKLRADESALVDKLLDDGKKALHASFEARLGQVLVEIGRVQSQLAEGRRAAVVPLGKRVDVEKWSRVADELGEDFSDRHDLRALFDKVIKRVFLVKTSPPRCRQVLEVDRLELRDGHWI